MSRLELAKIPAITFYKDAYTAARRTEALPQLVCVGKPCRVFQPEVVRCVNLGGGVGTDVDWKCEADLPEALRFGKVEVSCEGWSKAGDPYVLKGSCSLEYRLVQVPGSLLNGNTDSPSFKSFDIPGLIFSVLWIAVLFFILYSFFLSCFRRNNETHTRHTTNPGPRPDSGGSGWFPGGFNNDSTTGPPPPYSKQPNQAGGEGWRPGFWSGAAAAGAANWLWNRRSQAEPRQRSTYDWERERAPPPRAPLFGGRRTYSSSHDDRAEGSSNLGSMRRSTGLGGSSVR